MSFDEIWWPIRALRATPPSLAQADPERSAVFAASLEQAEQLLRSAHHLGPAARPLNLFYGLSQAGRALSAAFIREEPGWKLSGHGIRATDYMGNLEDIQVSDNGSDRSSFLTMARLLGSPSLPEKVPLGKILAATPAARIHTAPWMNEPGPLDIQPEWHTSTSTTGRSQDLDALSRRFLIRGDCNIVGHDGWSKIENSYPQLQGCMVGKTVRSNRLGAFLAPAELPKSDAMPLESLQDAPLFEEKLLRFEGRLLAIPVLPGSTEPQHPLISWWATLYTISTIARYEPGLWATSLAVDASPRAVPLELILDSALSTIPELVSRAFADLILQASCTPEAPH